jgi:hypothetical protein
LSIVMHCCHNSQLMLYLVKNMQKGVKNPGINPRKQFAQSQAYSAILFC